MKRFSAIVLTSLLLATPGFAFTVDVPLPNLTFPEPAPAPEPSRACIAPGQITAPGCPATE